MQHPLAQSACSLRSGGGGGGFVLQYSSNSTSSTVVHLCPLAHLCDLTECLRLEVRRGWLHRNNPPTAAQECFNTPQGLPTPLPLSLPPLFAAPLWPPLAQHPLAQTQPDVFLRGTPPLPLPWRTSPTCAISLSVCSLRSGGGGSTVRQRMRRSLTLNLWHSRSDRAHPTYSCEGGAWGGMKGHEGGEQQMSAFSASASRSKVQSLILNLWHSRPCRAHPTYSCEGGGDENAGVCGGGQQREQSTTLNH
jgi:hypothetical protein